MTPGIIGESDLSGNLQSEYVFFDGERVARMDLPSGAVSYYFSDHLKTTDIVTDAQKESFSGGGVQFVANDSITTNSPAKNVIQKPSSIILGPGITEWARALGKR